MVRARSLRERRSARGGPGRSDKEGRYIVRLKAPAGCEIAAHNLPNDENVTAPSGSFNIGTGDKLDETKGTRIGAGDYSFIMKGMSTTRGSRSMRSSRCTGWDRRA